MTEEKQKKVRKKSRKTLTALNEGMASNELASDISEILAGERPLSQSEARLLVDMYYQIQGNRVATNNRVKAAQKNEEPTSTLEWFMDGFLFLEYQIKKVLEIYVDSDINGRWLKSHRGIGPVISAGLLAHIDINKAKTAGAIWRFAGLDPTSVWKKKTKRPWNGSLKRLCWILGESFVKFSPSLYNTLYKERKALEIQRNESGLNTEEARRCLPNFDKSTDAYQAYVKDKLPDGRIHLRAQRWAVKIFLAHYHEQLWRETFGTMPPNPYVLEHKGHVHKIETEIPFTTAV